MSGGGRPTFESERLRVATIVEGIKDTLPSEVVLEVENDENVTSCGGGDLITGGGDGTQISAYRRVIVTPDFDAIEWLDNMADEYEKKQGWKVDRHREHAATGSSRNVFWAPAGNRVHISLDPGKQTDIGFNAREDAVGEPVQRIAIGASAECADKPSNWDGFGDFLTETPLPTP